MFSLRHGKYHSSGKNVVDNHPGLGVLQVYVSVSDCWGNIHRGKANVSCAEVYDFLLF